MLENFENGKYTVVITRIEVSSVTYNGEVRTKLNYMLQPQNRELFEDLCETQENKGDWKLSFKFTARSDEDLYKHLNEFATENLKEEEMRQYEKIKGNTIPTIINFLNDCLHKSNHVTVASIIKDFFQGKAYYRVPNILSEKRREANKQCEEMRYRF